MPLNNWYWQTLLMRKRIGFILFEKVTILDIYPHKGIYFFETIFENYRICPMFEFSVSEKKMFEKFVSEQEIWVARIVVRKKLIWIVTQKCLPKNLQKQHCCISDGWRWKKVTVKSYFSSPKNEFIVSKVQTLSFASLEKGIIWVGVSFSSSCFELLQANCQYYFRSLENLQCCPG